MIVDGIWSSIGSANFDDRSFELNDEIQFGILDPEIALQFEEAWAEDLRFARKVELAEWNRRGLWHRLKDRMGLPHQGAVVSAAATNGSGRRV